MNDTQDETGAGNAPRVQDALSQTGLNPHGDSIQGFADKIITAESKPELPICPNCGKGQRPTGKGFSDCFHECAKRGFAPVVSSSGKTFKVSAKDRKFLLFYCTPCDMEREHINAEGYWNCIACGASIAPSTSDPLSYRELEHQRDELLAALKDIRDFGRSYGITEANAVDGIRDRASAAIARAENGAQAQ